MFELLIFFLLGLPTFVYAQATPSTSDLFDISQGVFITAFSPAPLDSRTDIRNLFGGSFGSVEIGNTFFRDGLPAGTVHSVEWATATPVELSQVIIFASHNAAPFDANVRGIRTLRFLVKKADGTFQLLAEFSPRNPYGGGELGNEFRYEIPLDQVVGQRFRAEFVQFGDSRPTASGPKVIEIDGFGQSLPAPVLPAPVTNDLWDISQGTTITSHSGVTTQHGGADIRDMFGGTFWDYQPDFSKTDFRDDKLAGFVHFVEWQTPTPVRLERFRLLADHDAFDLENPSQLRDANSRGFRRFTLLAKDAEGAWQKISEFFPTNPYGQGDPPHFKRLVIDQAVPVTVAQQFRAEFEQFGDKHPLARGPRLEELDGFGDAAIDPEPVIIVPGMLASISPVGTFSNQLSNFWIFTPGAHGFYKSLLEQFGAADFKENEKVFVAHYNWRKPVSESAANYLKPMIERVKQETGSDKVDIVAHSMGGLVARSYIQGSSYENDVDQLITLGTPHQGAADAYVAWEGGEFPLTWSGSIKSLVRGITNALNFIQGSNLEPPIAFRTFFPGLKDLLPITNFTTKSGTNIPVTSLAEQNSSLQNLQTEIDKLENRGVDVTAIVGTDVQTLGAINLTTARTTIDAALQRWRDGHPSQDPILPDSSAGDQRVLASSAQIGSDIITLPEGNHEKLPHLARRKVLEMLGIEIEEFQYEPPDMQSLLGITILSPIDPKVTCGSKVLSPTQNTFGETAQYIADPNALDSPKLLLIGNPPEGKCTITLTGTESGNYHAITCFADQDQDVCTVREGTTSSGKIETYSVGITNNTFQPPVEDITALLRQLKNRIFELLLDKHIKVAGSKLHGFATRLRAFGENWEKAVKKSGETSKDAKNWHSKMKSDFATFSQELDTQIKRGNLNATAIIEIVPLRDQLKDAGL